MGREDANAFKRFLKRLDNEDYWKSTAAKGLVNANMRPRFYDYSDIIAIAGPDEKEPSK